MLYVAENKPEDLKKDVDLLYRVDDVKRVNRQGEICIELSTTGNETSVVSSSDNKNIYIGSESIHKGDLFGIKKLSDTDKGSEYWELLERQENSDQQIKILDDNIVCPVCHSNTKKVKGIARCTNNICGRKKLNF